MIDNRYTKMMSSLTLSQRDKNDLIQKMYEARREQAAEKPVYKKKVKRANVLVSAVAAAAVLITVCAILLTALLVNSPADSIVVDNPLEEDARMYIGDTVQNAQYLPNVKLLAGSNDDFSDYSQGIALSSDYSQELKSYEYCYDDKIFDMGLKSYEELAESFGSLDSTLRSHGNSIEDIKDEMLLMLKIIPGSDQWFMIPNTPQVDLYTNKIYKISYDEEAKKVNMMRVAWNTVVDLFDSDSGTIYSTSFDNDCYQSELLTVNYYFDEQDREVVECVNTRYYYFKGEYVPVFVQVLKNVKDTSATKLSVYFTVENELVEEYYSSAHQNVVDSVYTLQDVSEYGVVSNFVQLDYTDSSDVTLLKAIKSYPSMFTGNPSATNYAFYKINGNDKVYYAEAWDYLSPSSEGTCALRNYFGERYDGGDIPEAVVKNILLRDRDYYYVAKQYCDNCVGSDFEDSDFIKTCSHLKTADKITRGEKFLAYNPDSIYQDENLVREGIAASLEKIYSTVNGTQRDFLEGEGNRYVFETAFDDYTRNMTEYYVDNVFDFSEKIDTIKSSREYDELPADDVEDILDGKYLLVKECVSNSTFADGVLDYDIQYAISRAQVNVYDKYYMAIYLNDYDGIVVLDSREIDMSKEERKGRLQGSVSCEGILDKCPWILQGNAAYAGEVCTGIIAYDKDGNAVSVTEGKEVAIEGEPWEKESVYDRDGHVMRYYFRADATLYFNFYVYWV